MVSLHSGSSLGYPDAGAPLKLLCELTTQPLGIATATPLLSWWVNDSRPAEMQSAYEILVATSLERLQEQRGDLWQSGRVDDSSNMAARYAGVPLTPLQQVWWKVRTYDSDGVASPWSEPATFETAGALADDARLARSQGGFTERDDWLMGCPSEWIGVPQHGSLRRGVPVAALRRSFEVPEVPIKARLYVACLGDYRLAVNGVAVAESISANAWSDYEQQAWFQTFDLTDYVVVGENVLGVLLADGYYAGELPDVGRGCFGSQPQLRAFLAITTSSGRVLQVHSDGQWQWRSSWILAADPFGQEHVDARQMYPRWSLPHRAAPIDAQEAGAVSGQFMPPDGAWQSVSLLTAPTIRLLAQSFEPLGIREVLRPLQAPTSYHEGRHRTRFVYDFGVCVSGRVRIELNSRAVDEVLVEYGLDGESFGVADSYTSDGQGDAQLIPLFATHTFRYVRVYCDAKRTQLTNVVALRIGIQQAPALQLRCDHATLNGLFEVLQNSLHDVSQSLPLRGIERTQRMPDLSYALTWAPLMARDLRTHGLVTKWLHDLMSYVVQPDLSRDDPLPMEVVSPADVLLDGQTVDVQWGEQLSCLQTLAHTAWALYRHHGDRRALEICFPTLRAEARAWRHLDGWPFELPIDVALFGRGESAQLIAACSVLGTLRVIARMAAALRRTADAELLWGQAADLRHALRRRYISQDGHLFSADQSSCVAALHWGLLEGAERGIAQTRLLDTLQADGYEAGVVPGLTSHLLPVLTEAGRLDVAYMVLLQTSADSWLGNVMAGTGYVARRAGEFDIAQVGIGHWILQSLVGIALPEEPSDTPSERALGEQAEDHVGYRRVRIAPMPPLGKQFLAGAPVRMMHAQLATVAGEYAVTWRIGEERFELELLVPPSCSAEVVMPDGIAQTVSSGRHEFFMSFGAGGDGIPTLLDMTDAYEHQA